MPRKKKIASDEILEQGGRIPPQDVEIERNVLSAMLLDNEGVAMALEILGDADFYKDKHKIIFNAMVSLYQKNEAVDILTLTDELRSKGELEEIGGAGYVSELASLVPSSANIEYHMRIIRDKGLLRKLIHSCTDILKESYESSEEAESILSMAQQAIFDISKEQKQKSYEVIKPILYDTFAEIERLHHLDHSGIIGIPSGFTSLDDITAGFQKGDLIIIAGRPSMGKTAFALNLARNAGVEYNIPVGFFSLEMSDMQLAQRLLCSEVLVDSQRLRTGRLREKEWPKLSKFVGKLAEAPLYIDDTPALDIIKLSARARRMCLERDIGCIIVDYMQLMEGPRGMDNRQQEIAFISRSLKTLAKQLNIPIIALSQLSRAVEARPGNRPNLSDLRESGAIEQDADLVMFVYREEVYLKDPEEIKRKQVENIAEIIIGKHRNGPIGTIQLTFLKQFGKFSDKPKYAEEEVGDRPSF